ncbi:DMT family transporter [Olsenella massiliensis]|uniref:DMT family transporter n=1 Tax=Olsenella massiliensis TaxID=1622075 RepID=UPI00071CC7BC|nr:DMT family transporter [Olsenella massiliensis]
MRFFSNIPVWAYELAITLSAMIWGGSFVVLKGAVNAMPPGWLLALRFAASSLVVAVAFRARVTGSLDGSHLLAGVLVGLPLGVGYLIQNIGLIEISPGRNAFLTATYCVMVPFLNWAATHVRPRANNLLAALVVLAGVGLLSMDGELGPSLSRGDLLTLASALMFATNIVLVGRLGSAHDAVTITVVSLATSSLVCLGYALHAEALPAPGALPLGFWGQMLYLVFLSTIFATLAQNVGQRHVDPSKTALLLSLESVFAVLFSVIFYGELLTPRLVLGFALIFAAVLVSELMVPRVRERSADPVAESSDRGRR